MNRAVACGFCWYRWPGLESDEQWVVYQTPGHRYGGKRIEVWIACPTCQPLIVAGDFTAIAERAYRAFRRDNVVHDQGDGQTLFRREYEALLAVLDEPRPWPLAEDLL